MTKETPLAASETDALIPRAVLFGNPLVRNPLLSRDGAWLAWMAPANGVLNLWLAPRGRPDEARQMTFETNRAPGSAAFANDGRHLLFTKDNDGDENSHLHAIDMATGEIRNLTPYAGARCGLMAMSRHIVDRVLVRMNDRDPRYHDIYSVVLATGERTLVEQNDAGYSSFVCDDRYRLRFARIARDDGGAIVRRRVGDAWIDWLDIEPDDVNTTSLSHVAEDGTTLYLFDSRGRDTSALIAIDSISGTSQLLAQDECADIDGVIVDPKNYRPLAWASGEIRRRYKALDGILAEDIAMLDAAGIGDWSPLAMTDDLAHWLIGANSDTAPGVVWLYDRAAQRLEKLFETRPDLAGRTLARVHPVRITARDGLRMVAYLTLPAFADATRDDEKPRTRLRVPMVVIVHGGPATRDRFGFDSEAQWLADRGYAVLKVNYRGSTGFGKAFQAAGNLQWGLAMSDDVDDAVDWVIAEGIADADRIAITGGSYGGYAVLVALTRTPRKYACGIDLVGPSNLVSLIETVPPYWASIRKAWLRSVGDPETLEGLASLKARSPLHKAQDIERPLLIGHGANDPRVKRAEADQMVAALQANAVPVTYALFSDEGHGFGRPANAICFAGLKEMFLAHHIGGTAEPLTLSERLASTMQIVEVGDVHP